MSQAMQRAQKHWQAQRRTKEAAEAMPKPPTPAWTIAISRQAGTNGPRIAHAVGKRLGWAVYDRELVEHIANEKGLRVKLLESLDEKSSSWLVESLQALGTHPDVTMNAYVQYLGETIHSLGRHGDCVIVGRGAAQLLPAERTLRVRLVAPRADRIASICDRLGVSHEDAGRWVDKADRERTRFVQEHFKRHPDEAEHYDLILNTARFSIEDCVGMIVEALGELQKHSQPAEHVAVG
jgi:cytidylate kinase